MGATDVTFTALLLVSISRIGFSQLVADVSLSRQQRPSDQDKIPATEATLQKMYITSKELTSLDGRSGIEIDNALTTKESKMMDDLYHVTTQTVDDIHTKEEIVPSYNDGDTFDRQLKPSEKLYQTTTNSLNDFRRKQEITEREAFTTKSIISTNGVPITKNIGMKEDVRRNRSTTITADSITATTETSRIVNSEMTHRSTTKSDDSVRVTTSNLKQTEQKYKSTTDKNQLVVTTIMTTPTTEVKQPVNLTPWWARFIGENISTSHTTIHIESKDYSTSMAKFIEDSTRRKTTPIPQTSSVSTSHLPLTATDPRKQTSAQKIDERQSAVRMKSTQNGQTSAVTTVKQVNVRSSPGTVRMTTSPPTSSMSSYLPLTTTDPAKQTKAQQIDDSRPPVTSKNIQDGLMPSPTTVEHVDVYSSRKAATTTPNSPTPSVSSNLRLTTTARGKHMITQRVDESTSPVTSASTHDEQTSTYTKRVDSNSSSVIDNSNLKTRALLRSFYQRLHARCSQNFVLESFQGLRGVIQCAVKCSLNNQCKSFNYINTNNFCQLNSQEIQNLDYDGIPQQGTCDYYQKV
ncbi:hypothetical protein HOLleu_17499 [Holothuria leucospilota]|uniref:Apple domain-containing protein n=1 Tax=Holothuria leucospilota TaxID=206669 RepID=A0A9Q1H8V7_HOLLE|nr:hypothetical protein HOLleu_17499 [Holothuria leucospilota]